MTYPKFPVLYYEQNVLFDIKRQAWAAYRIPQQPYAFASQEKKRAMVDSLRQFLHAHRGACHLLSLTDDIRPTGFFQADHPGGDEFERYKQAVIQKVSRQRPWRRSLFLLVKLPKSRFAMPDFDLAAPGRALTSVGAFVKGIGQSLQQRFIVVPSGEMNRQVLEDTLSAETLVAQTVRASLGGERLISSDIEWLLCHPLHRAIVHEHAPRLGLEPSYQIAVRGEQVWLRPRKSLPILVAGNTVIEERLRTLVVHHQDDGSQMSWQTFFFLVDVPEEVSDIGSEWLYRLDDLSDPVECSIHLALEAPHTAAAGLERSRKALKDQQREYVDGTGELPMTLEWAGDRGRLLEHKLQHGMPLVHATITYAIFAPTREALEARATQFTQLCSTLRLRVVRSPGDQARGFYDFMPGTDIEKKPWSLPMDPGYLAAGMPHGSRDAGDPTGDYIGRTRQGTPVLLDLARPMSRELNRSGAVGIVGTLGGGKSVLKKLLFYLAFNRGGSIFSIDPKDEDGCFADMPAVAKGLTVLRLSAGSRTQINPFRLSRSEERSHAIALDYLSLLLDGQRNDERADILMDAVERTFSTSKRDLFQVMTELQKLSQSGGHEAMRVEARRCLTRLQGYRKSPYGRLVFARDNGVSALPETPFVVASLAGLPLPKRVPGETGNFTPNERFGVGMMYLMAALGRERMFHTALGGLKLFGIDETWLLRSFPEGRQLIDETVRMGRSYGVVPVLVTQNPGDIAEEELRNNLGSIFCFRTEDPRASRDNAILLGLDPDEASLWQAFRSLRSGDCFFKDIEGRVSLIHVDPTPDDLLTVFNTSVDGGRPS
ncbi:ATP-binding protein [Alicyclobacillus fodiniaquatilis]|uniref:ATP-binding protein n=1 Tax=Alicyclobacillus fodiniaquatilis TaxID=1661150 RepID=A0ABW4JFS2_9BACL